MKKKNKETKTPDAIIMKTGDLNNFLAIRKTLNNLSFENSLKLIKRNGR